MALYFSQPEDREIHLDEMQTIIEKLENKEQMGSGRILWNKVFSRLKGIFTLKKKNPEMELADK
jgi:hypothetical protein